MTIYKIDGTCGYYYDGEEWHVESYTNREEAIKHFNKLNEYLIQYNYNKSELRDKSEYNNPYDMTEGSLIVTDNCIVWYVYEEVTQYNKFSELCI